MSKKRKPQRKQGGGRTTVAPCPMRTRMYGRPSPHLYRCKTTKLGTTETRCCGCQRLMPGSPQVDDGLDKVRQVRAGIEPLTIHIGGTSDGQEEGCGDCAGTDGDDVAVPA